LQNFAEEEFGLCFSTSKNFFMNLGTSQNQLFRTQFAEVGRRRIWALFLNFHEVFNDLENFTKSAIPHALCRILQKKNLGSISQLSTKF
jgi:hypothetical protein